MMKWQILIATQDCRDNFRRQLHSILAPQCDGKEVAICEMFGSNSFPIGDKRQLMRHASTAEYISFVDDDDLVSRDYVSRILPMLDGVDTVTFDFQIHYDGVPTVKAYHSLAHGGWFPKGQDLYRDISHITPMRRELAIEVPMEGGVGEDFRWAERMRAKGIVKTEHHLEGDLYYYLWRTEKNDAVDWREPKRMALLAQLQDAGRLKIHNPDD